MEIKSAENNVYKLTPDHDEHLLLRASAEQLIKCYMTDEESHPLDETIGLVKYVSETIKGEAPSELEISVAGLKALADSVDAGRDDMCPIYLPTADQVVPMLRTEVAVHEFTQNLSDLSPEDFNP